MVKNSSCDGENFMNFFKCIYKTVYLPRTSRQYTKKILSNKKSFKIIKNSEFFFK